MNFTTPLFAALLFLSASCQSQTGAPPSQEERYAELGVKTVKSIKDEGETIREYNEKGHMISSQSTGSMLITFEYKYDGDLMLEQLILREGKPFRKHTYTYDDQGRETGWKEELYGDYPMTKERTTTYEGNTKTSVERSMTTVETLDERGNTVKETTTDDKGKMVTESEYTYNEKGWVTRKESVMAMASGKVTISYTYDENGNVIKRLKEGFGDNAYTFSYDDRGLMTQETWSYGEKVVVTRYEYTFR